MGWDGPLGALSQKRTNIADYFKETVAVVTNPAIDRERERAQFSMRMVLGVRPMVGENLREEDILLELETPLLLGGHSALGDLAIYAHSHRNWGHIHWRMWYLNLATMCCICV